MHSKRSITIAYILIAFIIIFMVGATYSYFSGGVEGETKEIIIQAGGLTLNFSEATSVSASIAPGDFVTKTIAITNPTDSSIYYNLNWAEMNNTFINDELHIKVDCRSYKNYSDALLKEEYGSCSGKKDSPIGTIDSAIITNSLIEPNLTHEYFITLTFIETGSAQNYNKNKEFNGLLKISGTGVVSFEWYDDCISNKSLRCKILNDNTPYADSASSLYVSSVSGINFSATASSTNGKGLYYTTDITKTQNGKRVYYFRGEVENNYVLFQNMCFRIVRTTEEGYTKLRYSGVPVNDVCPQTGSTTGVGSTYYLNANNSNSNIGYMYGSTCNTYNSCTTNRTNSALKTAVDNWYSSSINTLNQKYKDMISDVVYCNDRKVSTNAKTNGIVNNKLGYGTSATVYNAYDRYYNSTTLGTANPTFVCAQDNDKFTVSEEKGNGSLTYPVGVLTVDEAYYAGSILGTGNTTTYLYSNENSWLMTPAYYNSGNAMFFMGTDRVSVAASNGNYKFHPVIALNKYAIVSEGTGSAMDPYIIQ